METFMNVFLVVPATLPNGNTPIEMYNDSGLAIVAFFAFILILYLIISADKSKKSRIRNN